ncbi:MAG TPA: hypothetical protein VLZ75_12800 [Chitinophagales bacterium]|nr:hypothetical protein [Chitinophagales bacterium]
MKFSQRIGKTEVREILQVESIDERLENRLWNVLINDLFYELDDFSDRYKDSKKGTICKIIWVEFFCYRIDEIPTTDYGFVNSNGVIKNIKNWFFKAFWYEKYDLLEFLSSIEPLFSNLNFTKSCNEALKTEMSGYRLINNSIVQITSNEEIVEIQQALLNSSKWTPVNTHLTTSLKFLSNRDNPDYRNSIKESISAIESLCVILTGNSKATLGQALAEIGKTYQIHGALKNAFSSLYGYTSDAGGIRHSLIEEDITVTMEDAKFMLISCSAFINYLKVKIEK